MLPLLSIQCMSRRDLSVKGGTRERCYRTRRGRTDERTVVCHTKPVFWRAYKNERPISWNYEYIIFGQIIFQNFHQFKAFVGLSDCRIIATAPFPPLALDLLRSGIYMCGTIRQNRKYFPEDLKNLPVRIQPGKYVAKQSKNLTAVVWMDNRHVSALSTNESLEQVKQMF